MQINEFERSAETRDGLVSHLESQVAELRETVETQDTTIAQLTATNKLLKRCLFVSVRERFSKKIRRKQPCSPWLH